MRKAPPQAPAGPAPMVARRLPAIPAERVAPTATTAVLEQAVAVARDPLVRGAPEARAPTEIMEVGLVGAALMAEPPAAQIPQLGLGHLAALRAVIVELEALAALLQLQPQAAQERMAEEEVEGMAALKPHQLSRQVVLVAPAAMRRSTPTRPLNSHTVQEGAEEEALAVQLPMAPAEPVAMAVVAGVREATVVRLPMEEMAARASLSSNTHPLPPRAPRVRLRFPQRLLPHRFRIAAPLKKSSFSRVARLLHGRFHQTGTARRCGLNCWVVVETARPVSPATPIPG